MVCTAAIAAAAAAGLALHSERILCWNDVTTVSLASCVCSQSVGRQGLSAGTWRYALDDWVLGRWSSPETGVSRGSKSPALFAIAGVDRSPCEVWTCRGGAVLSAENTDAMHGNCTAADGDVRSEAGVLDRAAAAKVRLPGIATYWWWWWWWWWWWRWCCSGVDFSADCSC